MDNNKRTNFQLYMDESIPEWENKLGEDTIKKLERNYEAYELYEDRKSISQMVLTYLDTLYGISMAVLQVRAKSFEEEIQEIKKSFGRSNTKV